MPVLTKEQKLVWKRRKEELFPGNKLKVLNDDYSVRTWWASVTDELSKKMTEIDREQAASTAESSTKWVGAH